MTLKTIKTNVAAYPKKTGGACFCLLGVFTLLCGMRAWGETRTLLTNDEWGTSAIVQGARWFDPAEKPVSTHDYVVTGEENKNTIRTPASFGSGSLPGYYSISAGKTNVTFNGNSLTLNSGATLVLKHQNGAYVTIPTLYLDGGSEIKEANGQDNGFLDGTFYIRGTSANPVKFIGSCENYTYRWFKVAASLVGEKTAVLDISSSADTTKGHARSFHVELHGDNSNYQGRFEVKGSHLHGVELVAKHANALGAGDPSETEPVLSLIDGGDKRYVTTFWGMDGYYFTNPNYTLNIQGDVRIGGRSADENGVGLYFGNEAKITGNGSLIVKSYGDTGAAVALSKVIIDDSVTGIVVTNDSCLVLGEGYSNTQPISIATGSSLTISCPTLTGGDAALVETGVLTKDAADKIKIAFDPVVLCKLNAGTVVNILSASNLGTDDGLTLDDFVFDVAWATEFATAFSIENKALVLTRPQATFVFLNGKDDNNSASFAAKSHWDDTTKPEAGKSYLVVNSPNRLRSGEKANQTFAGDSLTIANGGDMTIIGGMLTFKELRMGAGGAVWPVRSHQDMVDSSGVSPSLPLLPDTLKNNGLVGKGVVFAPKENPFKVFFTGGASGQTRSLRLYLKLSGSGDLAFVHDTAAAHAASWVSVTNDNTAFKGGITVDLQVSGKTLGVDFANEAAMGGPIADGTFRADRLKLVGNATFRCSSSYDMTDETRGITIENGATFRIEDGQTLNIGNKMTGNGLITKTGTGMLGLGGDNTLTDTDRVWVQGGGLTLAHKNALSKRPVDLGLKNSIVKTTLRIETEGGIMIKAGADAAFKLKRTEAVGSNIEPNAIPDLEVAELENLTGSSKEVTLFRYESAESLEDHDAFKAKFNLVFPSSGNYKVAWGTKEITVGKEYAVTVTVKPTGFAIFVR